MQREHHIALDMLQCEHDEVDSESDSDDDYNEDEVMCEGSHVEFYNFDKDEVPPKDLDF